MTAPGIVARVSTGERLASPRATYPDNRTSHRAPPRLTLSHHRGRAGFEALRTDWARLAANGWACRFYQSADWYAAYLDALEPDPESFHFFEFRAESRLLAILPLRQCTITLRGLPLRGLEFPAHFHMILNDAVAPFTETGEASFAQVLRGLEDQHEVPWDILSLKQVPSDSFVHRGLVEGASDRVVSVPECQARFVPCRASPDLIPDRISPEFRRNLQRLSRRAERAGTIEYQHHRTPAELRRAFEEFLRVESSGWKGSHGEGSAIAMREDLKSFYGRLVDAFGPKGECIISLMRLDGRCIAGHFALRTGGVHAILKIGYDEAHADLAPGNQLMLRVLTDCASDPAIDEVSFGTDPPWSRQWRAEGRTIEHHRIYNRTLRGELGLLAHRLHQRLGDGQPGRATTPGDPEHGTS